MDFAYSQEQQMLTDSLQRVMLEQWRFDQRRARFAQGKLDRQAWRQLAELGVTGLMVPAQYEGFGETPATMLAVHQVLGRGIVSEPVIASAVMAVVMLSDCDESNVKSSWLGAHARGDAIFSVAWQEEGERYGAVPLTTQLRREGDTWLLTGRKRHVWHAAGADAMIVSAQLDGEMALVLVKSDVLGVTMDDFPTFDLARCANVAFDSVKLDATALLARGQQAQVIFAKGFDYAITALCAHACGAMQYLIEITTAYLKTRNQFGQPLIHFQVLQHRLADMLIQQELALSATFVAAAALSEPSAHLRSKRVSMVKTEVANAARYVGEQTIQLYGGMGVTDELEVGDYFKRLVFVSSMLGDNNFHLARAQTMSVV
jgi:alkylation response protein AidB-like acyl-CoA dehydrogenase